VRMQAAATLGRASEGVPRDTGFIELGMDSFSSIELTACLEYLFDRELPDTLTFDYPTVDAVTGYLADLLAAAPTQAPIERIGT
jgi:acyl carrier protein